MAWPSKNVAFGGILHPAKSSYSPETQQFLKVLMDESKLTMFQRRQINYSLRSGEPLPAPSSQRNSRMHNKSDSLLLGKAGRNCIQPGPSQRRSRDTIVQSGAYERERFILNEPIRDRELEKKKLQNKMAFGKDIEKKSVKKMSKPKVIKEDPQLSRFEQLMNEIQEREEFLEEMEKLGEGEKHRVVIKQQIRARMNEIEKLKLDDEL